MKAIYPVDLHAHTNRSDGNDTVIEFIDHAVTVGMSVIAMTDHDVAPATSIIIDNKEIDTITYAKQKGLQLVLGSEISCDTNNEDVHLVVFGINWQHPKFKELENQVVLSKIEAYQELVNVLTKEGYPLSWQELLDNEGSPIMEQEIQKKLIFNMLAKKGYFPSWKDAKLFTQQNPKCNVLRKKPDPIAIIEMVHQLGGMVIDAHPFLIRPNPEPLFEYLQPLLDAGLDGIEASYPYHKTNYKGTYSDHELKEIIHKRFKDSGLFISGGSDYHGEWRKNAPNARQMGEAGISLEEFRNSMVYKKVNAWI